MNEKDKKNKIKLDSIQIAILEQQNIQIHGEAASQMIQAYKGTRYDSAGNDIGHKGRNLKDISEYKLNDKYKENNLKQQSGFSGELLKEANDNREAILNDDKNRTRTTDGVGKTNDQVHDHTKVDSNGDIITNSGSQMKMLKDHKKVVDKMVKDDWEKYNDSPMDIPSEQVEPAKAYAREQSSKLRDEADIFEAKGNMEKAENLRAKADKYDQAEKNIRDSGVSSKDAMDARVNPEKFVIKEVLSDSHRAGIEGAKAAALLSSSISLAQNGYAVIFEGKDIDKACLDVTKTVAVSAGTGYVIKATGTSIKAIMHSSKNSLVRSLGKTSAPAMIASSIVEIGKSFISYAKGDIDEFQLLKDLGEKGVGMTAASYGSASGAVIGTMLLPGIGTTIGAVVGGMIGYTLSSIFYKASLTALKDRDISRERRKIIEEISKQSIKEMEKYQIELIKMNEEKFKTRENIFQNIFSGIYENDIDKAVSYINKLGKNFGVDLKFNNFEEFDRAMQDDSILITL